MWIAAIQRLSVTKSTPHYGDHFISDSVTATTVVKASSSARLNWNQWRSGFGSADRVSGVVMGQFSAVPTGR